MSWTTEFTELPFLVISFNFSNFKHELFFLNMHCNPDVHCCMWQCKCLSLSNVRLIPCVNRVFKVSTQFKASEWMCWRLYHATGASSMYCKRWGNRSVLLREVLPPAHTTHIPPLRYFHQVKMCLTRTISCCVLHVWKGNFKVHVRKSLKWVYGFNPSFIVGPH